MKSNLLTALSVRQLQRALDIKQQIEALEKELAQILGTPPEAPAPAAAPTKRTMSAAAKAKIAKAQKARWAARRKADAPSPAAPPKTKEKRKLSAAGRARIVAATKERWAKFWAAKKAAKSA
jgi:hypothetical protein